MHCVSLFVCTHASPCVCAPHVCVSVEVYIELADKHLRRDGCVAALPSRYTGSSESSL